MGGYTNYGNPRDCPGIGNVGKRWLIQSKESRTENLLGEGQGKGEKERRELNPCQRLKEKLTTPSRIGNRSCTRGTREEQHSQEVVRNRLLRWDASGFLRGCFKDDKFLLKVFIQF